MKTQLMAPILLAALISQAMGNSALLVNFRATGTLGPPSDASRADFQALDPTLPQAADVNNISQGQSGPLVCRGLEGVQLDVGTPKSAFNSTKGKWTQNPILRSYLYQNAELESVVTLSGLDRVVPGTEMVLTLYGVGDASNQDTSFKITHGRNTQGALTSDYDQGTLDAASVRFLLTKEASANDIQIHWTGSPNASTAAFNALTLVVAPGNFETLGLIAD